MNKSELTDKLAADFRHLPRASLQKAANLIFEAMIKALEDGGRVEIRGFGALSVRIYPARTARNPKTGEAVAMKVKRLPVFKAGKGLCDRINQQ